MIIYPAIDIKDSECVRLLQGNFDNKIKYADNPFDVAEGFAQAGAEYIHIVDLDAARSGVSKNLGIIKKICGELGVKIQTGGGVRTFEDVKERIEAGVARVIMGSAAIKNPETVRASVEAYGDKVAVGIDAKDGMVAVSGWEEVSETSAVELLYKMRSIGVKTIIYTDIATDGMMQGTNISGLTEMISNGSGMNIIASGGISSLADLEIVAGTGATGAIVGQAIYKGAINLREAIEKFRK